MKRILWGFLICFFILFSLAPMFYEFSQKDKLVGRRFELVHNYITDYNFYLSRIRQGMEGRWTVVERYTSEPHAGSFIQIFYLLLGKPVSFFSDRALGATYAYHISRILLGFIFLWLIGKVVRRMFRPVLWQILAFLLVVTACSLPIYVPLADGWPASNAIMRSIAGWRLGQYMSWWTLMDTMQRITFIPHLLFGQIAILVLLCRPFEKRREYHTEGIIAYFTLAFIVGLVFPPAFLFVAATWFIESCLEFVFQLKKMLTSASARSEWIREKILPRMIICLGGIPTVAYYSFMLKMVPWRRLIEFDVLNPTWFPLPDYAKALGPMLILGIMGALLGVFRKEKETFVFISWIIAWAVLISVFRFIPQQSSLRFTQVAPHIPLGILTAYLFYTLSKIKYQKSKIHIINKIFEFPFLTHTLHTIVLVFPLALITLGLAMMYCSVLWQMDFINQKVAAGWPMVAMKNVIVYPITGFTDALSFIEKNTPADSVILSDLSAGNYIPAYAGRTVYVGHDNTIDKEKKLEIIQQFYTGAMKPQEARMWLEQNRITYVFWGPQERESQKDIPIAYPFLKEVYKNPDVTIFSVPPASPSQGGPASPSSQ